MVRVHAELVKQESLKDGLFRLFSFDDDYSGENGDEYLNEEAKQAGYDSNLAYWIDEAIASVKDNRNIPAIINTIVENYNSNWWIDVKTILHEDIWFCAVAELSKCD